MTENIPVLKRSLFNNTHKMVLYQNMYYNNESFNRGAHVIEKRNLEAKVDSLLQALKPEDYKDNEAGATFYRGVRHLRRLQKDFEALDVHDIHRESAYREMRKQSDSISEYINRVFKKLGTNKVPRQCSLF